MNKLVKIRSIKKTLKDKKPKTIYCVIVSYVCSGKDFSEDEMDKLDRKLELLSSCWSGSGYAFLSNKRDNEFDFKSEKAAKAFIARTKALGRRLKRKFDINQISMVDEGNI